MRWALTIGFIFVAIYYIAPRPMSFTVSASVESLQVSTVNEGSRDWALSVIEGCLRRSEKTPQEPTQAVPTVTECNEDFYVPIRISEPTLRWSEGYSLTFEGLSLDTMRIVVRHDGDVAPVAIDGFATQDSDQDVSRTITNGSILYIRWTDDRPILPLRGRIRIGSVPNMSDALILREGRYEIRQNLGLNPRPVVVGSGELVPGDRIGFARQTPIWQRIANFALERQAASDDLVSTLFLTDLSRFTQAFDVVATTPAEYGALRLTRIGVEPTIIPIAWTERLRADAIPIGISTLIGLLAGMLALANTYFKPPSNKD
ncbi:MAG: hypothetical protein AAFN59_07150 [Pseudomonadota bacterium]